MSQRSPLNTCFTDNKDTFDDLFTKFSGELNYHIKAKLLNSLVQAYILQFKEELESNIRSNEFFELLSQIPLLCSKFLKTSVMMPSVLDEADKDKTLEDKNECLESASLCFDTSLACLEALNETKHNLVMMKISLNILSQGYTHCKESEMIYENLLEQFANQLGVFFKKIENLQMIVLQELDKLDIKKCSGNEVNIDYIVLEMGYLCQIVFSLDADIAFELWTKYMRILNDHNSLKQISNIDSVSTYLATKNVEVLELIKYNLDKISDEDEELCAKFFFYFDALSNMLNLVHDSFKENIKSIKQFMMFLLNLFDCLISSYSSFILQKDCMNIVKNSIEKNTFTFVSYLYTDEEFLKSVIWINPDKQNHLCICLLQLCALQFMEYSSLQLKESMLKNIFSNFLQASPEDDMKFLHISIPQYTLTKTKSGSVTLYQFAYEQLKQFIKLLPDSSIQELDNTILDVLVSSSDVRYLLISDVWIYRLRFSNVEFLKDRCHSVLQKYRTKTVNNVKIENLIRRLLRFLPHSYRKMFSREYDFLRQIGDTKSIKHRYCVPEVSSPETEIFIESEEQIKTMICKLNECSTKDVTQLIQKACICLELCALFVNMSASSEILLFIEFAAEMFKSDVYEIQVAVLTFIRALSRKSVPEHCQDFEKIIISLALLFSSAMHSKNYIVRYEARNVFSHFAKCTPHIRIVQETIRRDPSLKPAVKAYINAVPDFNFSSSKEKAEYLQKQMIASKNLKFEIPTKIINSLQEMFSNKNL